MRLVFSPSSSVLSLAIAACLHIGIANAVARLGDTPAQCDARYGPARETGGLDADAIVWRRYFKSGYYITLVFMAKPFSETTAVSLRSGMGGLLR